MVPVSLDWLWRAITVVLGLATLWMGWWISFGSDRATARTVAAKWSLSPAEVRQVLAPLHSPGNLASNLMFAVGFAIQGAQFVAVGLLELPGDSVLALDLPLLVLNLAGLHFLLTPYVPAYLRTLAALTPKPGETVSAQALIAAIKVDPGTIAALRWIGVICLGIAILMVLMGWPSLVSHLVHLRPVTTP